jgi:hypothetical protein
MDSGNDAAESLLSAGHRPEFHMIDVTSSQPPYRERPRRTGSLLHRAAVPLAGAAAVALAVASCSTWSLTGGDTPSAATASSDGSFTSRVKSLFSGSSGSLNSAPTDFACPPVEYRQGAATWSVNGAGENSAMSLRHQASFFQTARECIVTDTTLTIKVGVQGRIVVGPAGGPGTVNVPLRFALVREGLHPKTLFSRLYTLPVAVPEGELNVPFVHVVEDITVPRPSPQDAEGYVVYVGFDPSGGGAPRPAATKPKPTRGRPAG